MFKKIAKWSIVMTGILILILGVAIVLIGVPVVLGLILFGMFVVFRKFFRSYFEWTRNWSVKDV